MNSLLSPSYVFLNIKQSLCAIVFLKSHLFVFLHYLMFNY